MKDIEKLKNLLLEMPFDELTALPCSTIFPYRNERRTITATIWRDSIGSDEIQLHLQVPSRFFGWLGIGYDCAMRVFRDGTWRLLSPEEWAKLGEEEGT
ncbi:MAG: hypothetical protein IKQ55_10940 [Kiritimatiellae bacterium]|nr:hypothetical protein [Kiritimatiellia bacterium]